MLEIAEGVTDNYSSVSNYSDTPDTNNLLDCVDGAETDRSREENQGRMGSREPHPNPRPFNDEIADEISPLSMPSQEFHSASHKYSDSLERLGGTQSQRAPIPRSVEDELARNMYENNSRDHRNLAASDGADGTL